MEIWSTLFLDEGVADWATCTVEISTWRRLTEENDGAKRLVAQIEGVNGKMQYIALGSPITFPTENDIPGHEKLFLPGWMLEALEISGTGETVEVKWLTEEAFPEATRIVLRPHDSAFYQVNAKEELERCLTRVGVLQLGQSIPLPLEGLGGYEIVFDVVELEPTHIVLANGEEVAIEFREALDQPLAPSLESSPPEASAPPAEDWNTPFEVPAAMTGSVPEISTGYRLGGTHAPRLSDGRPWNPWRDGPKPTA